MEDSDESTEYVVLNWPGVIYKIASGIGLLLAITLVFVMFNWRDLVRTYKADFQPVNCQAVLTK